MLERSVYNCFSVLADEREVYCTKAPSLAESRGGANISRLSRRRGGTQFNILGTESLGMNVWLGCYVLSTLPCVRVCLLPLWSNTTKWFMISNEAIFDQKGPKAVTLASAVAVVGGYSYCKTVRKVPPPSRLSKSKSSSPLDCLFSLFLLAVHYRKTVRKISPLAKSR
jgi:hypothetical protein